MTMFLLSGEPPGTAEEKMNLILNHALDHHLVDIGPVPLTRFGFMALLSAALLVMLARLLSTSSVQPRGLNRNMFESLFLFIRDEMLRPVMGAHHGDRFVPFFATIFLFIITMNLLGLVPLPVVGGTATSSFVVTGTLAAIVLLVGLVSGTAINGPVGLVKSFVPSGLPFWLVPLLFVLELFGFLIKHFVLMVRLFANMIAGHLVLGAFIGLIFLAQGWIQMVTAGASVLLALFISGLELLVAFIQAYVFTLLSTLFVGSVVHPDH